MSKETHNLPFDDLSRFQLASAQFYIHHDNQDQRGYECVYHFEPGILLRIIDLENYTDQWCDVCLPANQLMISFKLKGNNSLRSERFQTMDINAGSLCLGYSSQMEILQENAHKGEDYLMVMLLLPPELLLAEPFNSSHEALPLCIQSVLDGVDMLAERFTMSQDLLQSLRVLLNHKAQYSWSRAFLQAKAFEICCMALGIISQAEQEDLQGRISNKERQALEKIHQHLLQDWRQAPNQEALVQQYGLGKSQLKKNFKLLYGSTISDFILNQRMQKAQQLLAEAELNVTQVAAEVGYEHASSFAAAFKRQLGISPKAFQQTISPRSQSPSP